MNFSQPQPPSPTWPAALTLGFARHKNGTRLIHCAHHGPLRVQKPLYPEGPALCHAIVLHPPAGIAGGDVLALTVDADEEAQALLTTPGAGKWYGSAGRQASQTVTLNIGAGACVEWLPQENIVFDSAHARMSTRVALAAGARYLGVDTLCLGRRACAERFLRGRLQLACDIHLNGQPLWHERGVIDGASPLLDSPIGLAGFSVCSTLLAAGAQMDAQILAACRAVSPEEPDARCGATLLPQLFVGRYLGHSSEAARAWFGQLWQHLRPVFMGRAACMPRIWNT